jgi:hypothetical protein
MRVGGTRARRQPIRVECFLIEAVDTVEGVATREGIEYHGQHQSARGNFHPARHQMVDGVYKVDPIGIGFDDGKMVYV